MLWSLLKTFKECAQKYISPEEMLDFEQYIQNNTIKVKLKQTDKAAKDELTQLNADIDYKKQKIAQESKKDAKEQIDKATKEATEKKDN